MHTNGKLKFRPNGDANSYALIDESGNWWMSVLMNGEQLTATQEANLRRLAACWNACDGTPTEVLQVVAAFGGYARDDMVRHVTKERDDADRRAGAAERNLERAEEAAFARDSWLRKAKKDWGVDASVSFDVVWDEAKKLKQQRDELVNALEVAIENLRNHGDNCFVSDNYEGDPGNRCNCGVDGVEAYLIDAIASVKGGAA